MLHRGAHNSNTKFALPELDGMPVVEMKVMGVERGVEIVL
jgi:hypothetical protein